MNLGSTESNYGIWCQESVARIYLEITAPLLREGMTVRRLQIQICVFKQTIRFWCGVDPKLKEAYFSHPGFHIEEVSLEQIFS